MFGLDTKVRVKNSVFPSTVILRQWVSGFEVTHILTLSSNYAESQEKTKLGGA